MRLDQTRENDRGGLPPCSLHGHPLCVVKTRERPAREVANAPGTSRQSPQAKTSGGACDGNPACDASLQVLRAGSGLATGREHGVDLPLLRILLGVDDVVDELKRLQQSLERAIDLTGQIGAPETPRDGRCRPPHQCGFMPETADEPRPERDPAASSPLPSVAVHLLLKDAPVVRPERIARGEPLAEPQVGFEQQAQQVRFFRTTRGAVRHGISQNAPGEDVGLHGFKRAALRIAQPAAAPTLGPTRKHQSRQRRRRARTAE